MRSAAKSVFSSVCFVCGAAKCVLCVVQLGVGREHPWYSDALMNLAWVLRQRGELDRCTFLYEENLKLGVVRTQLPSGN